VNRQVVRRPGGEGDQLVCWGKGRKAKKKKTPHPNTVKGGEYVAGKQDGQGGRRVGRRN